MSKSNDYAYSNTSVYARVDGVVDDDEASEVTDLAFAKAIDVKHEDHGDDFNDAEIVVVVDAEGSSVKLMDNTRSISAGKTPMASMSIGPEGSDDVEAVIVSGHLVKGELQPSQYRDSWAAVLFLLQCIGMVGVAIAYFPYIGQAYPGDSASNSTFDTSQGDAEVASDDVYVGGQGAADSATTTDTSGFDFLLLLLICYAIAGLTIMSTLFLMMRYSEALVKVSFFFAPLLFLCIAFILFPLRDGVSNAFAVAALISSMTTLCCWFFYKKHIPFAAANLRSALTALRLNASTFGLAFFFSTISFAAMIVWVIAIIGVQSKSDSEGPVPCSDLHKNDDAVVYTADQMCGNPPNSVLIAALVLGFYWTQQVVQNVVHVTTAGVVGSWWFSPLGDPSCCSPTVTSSASRALTFSFGSICFGSLLVSIMQLLEYFARSSNRNGRHFSLVGCILQVRVDLVCFGNHVNLLLANL